MSSPAALRFGLSPEKPTSTMTAPRLHQIMCESASPNSPGRTSVRKTVTYKRRHIHKVPYTWMRISKLPILMRAGAGWPVIVTACMHMLAWTQVTGTHAHAQCNARMQDHLHVPSSACLPMTMLALEKTLAACSSGMPATAPSDPAPAYVTTVYGVSMNWCVRVRICFYASAYVYLDNWRNVRRMNMSMHVCVHMEDLCRDVQTV